MAQFLLTVLLGHHKSSLFFACKNVFKLDYKHFKMHLFKLKNRSSCLLENSSGGR